MLQQKIKKDDNLEELRLYLMLSLSLLKRLQAWISLRSLARRALRQAQDRRDEKKHRAQGKKLGYVQEL
jgi:hypothetical protein